MDNNNEKKYSIKDIEKFLEWIKIKGNSSIKEWEESKKEVFIPNDEQYYVVFDSDLRLLETTNICTSTDKRRIEAGNCFKSVEQANKIPVKLFFAMWRWKLSNDDVELNWKNRCAKYFLYYNTLSGTWKIDYCYQYTNVLNPYFSTQEKAEECIKWFEKQKFIKGDVK